MIPVNLGVDPRLSTQRFPDTPKQSGVFDALGGGDTIIATAEHITPVATAVSTNLDIEFGRRERWLFQRGDIQRIRVVSVESLNFDVEIYERNARDVLSRIFQNLGNDQVFDEYQDPVLRFNDRDNNRRLHIRIVNGAYSPATAALFQIEIFYIPRDPTTPIEVRALR